MSTADNPNVVPLKITNLGVRSITWEINCDDHGSEESSNSFSVSRTKGKLDYRDVIVIDAQFNPYKEGEFSQKIPVYVNGNYDKPCVEIFLKGIGQNPRLLFDRKEIILPIVPLGFISTTTFRVINDGYDNLELNHKIEQNLDGLSP